MSMPLPPPLEPAGTAKAPASSPRLGDTSPAALPRMSAVVTHVLCLAAQGNTPRDPWAYSLQRWLDLSA